MHALFTACWYRAQFAWYALDKGNVAFVALLPLPFVVLGALLHGMHAAHERTAVARSREAELRCLAENVYYEARGEALAGQYAVAEVTLNRRGSTLFPATVCAVVHEKRWDVLRKRHVGAFSWTEFERLPRPRGAAWQRAVEVATAVYDGNYAPRVPTALYYHASSIEPSWADPRRRVATIGQHVFYR